MYRNSGDKSVLLQILGMIFYHLSTFGGSLD